MDLEMKKIFTLAATAALFSLSSQATELKTDTQKHSYVIGTQIGKQLSASNIQIDEQALFAAISDMLKGRETQMTDDEMRLVVNRVREQQQQEAQRAGEENKKAGEAFLAKNAKSKGVKTLPSGLQYQVIKAGNGKKPTAADSVEAHYKGTLIDGTEFDSSYKRGQPATFPVQGVIKGWQEALPLMSEGAQWRIFVPSDLAYGERGAGDKIGPNSTLIFDIELFKVK